MVSKWSRRVSPNGSKAQRIGALLGALLLLPVAACDSSTAPQRSAGTLELAVDRAEYRLGDSIVVTGVNLGPGPIQPSADYLLYPCGIVLEREVVGAGYWEAAPRSDRSCAIALPGHGQLERRGVAEATLLIGATGADGSYWHFEPGTSYRWLVRYGVVIGSTFRIRGAFSPVFTVVQ